MKKNFIIALSFVSLLILSACTNQSGEHSLQSANEISHIGNDTIVVVNKVPEDLSGKNFTDVEYSISINNESYSPVVVISKGKNINILHIELREELGDYSIENMNDTSVIGREDPNKVIKQFDSSHEKYNAIRRILERASEDFDISKTTNIVFSLSLFEDESIEITELYNKKHDLENSIKESILYNELSALFKRYSVEIGRVNTEKFDWITPKKQYNKKSKGNPNRIIDTIICIETNR